MLLTVRNRELEFGRLGHFIEVLLLRLFCCSDHILILIKRVHGVVVVGPVGQAAVVVT